MRINDNDNTGAIGYLCQVMKRMLPMADEVSSFPPIKRVLWPIWMRSINHLCMPVALEQKKQLTAMWNSVVMSVRTVWWCRWEQCGDVGEVSLMWRLIMVTQGIINLDVVNQLRRHSFSGDRTLFCWPCLHRDNRLAAFITWSSNLN